MKLENSFDVQAPAEEVWSLLTDLARVAPCLPGAELTDAHGDGSYEGTFTVKLGPTTAAYRGKIHFEDRDDATHRAVMHASGQDKRGQGGATATIVTSVTDQGATSRVEVETDLVITGKLARFGRGGMIEDISNRLLRDFSTCLQGQVGHDPEPAEAATDGGAAGEIAGAQGPPRPIQAPPPSPGKPVNATRLILGAMSEKLVKLLRALWETSSKEIAQWRARRRG